MPNLDTLTIDAFRPHIGNLFRIRLSQDSALEAELVEARALGDPGRVPAAGAQRRVPFSLSFRTNQKGALPQRIYQVEHDQMGSYEIFLVPIGPDGIGMVYEAVFT